jgi:hypothetical protein
MGKVTTRDIWPLEADHQIEFFSRLEWYRRGPVDPKTMEPTFLPGYEALEFVAGSANGEVRAASYNSKGTKFSPVAQKLQRMGVKPGFPDIVCPVARVLDHEPYNHLYIELKRPGNKELGIDKGYPSPIQQKWLAFLRSQGNYACCCWGCDQAMEVLFSYLGLARDPREVGWTP